MNQTLDLDAPIMPGESAAGIRIGSDLTCLLERHAPRCAERLICGVLYDFESVRVIAKGQLICQVAARRGYRGALRNSICIGSTIAEVQDVFMQQVEEDECENLVVKNSPGWCFETEQWKHGPYVVDNLDAHITEIIVFSVEDQRTEQETRPS